jgi:trk system potassium uptake protein TrkH
MDAMDVIYEVTSAVSTVGNSTGITASLGSAPRIILVFLMYFGRVGILTVTYALMINQSSIDSTITYPDADLLIG